MRKSGFTIINRGELSFSAYLEWKNFLEFEDEFPKFHVVQELDDNMGSRDFYYSICIWI